MDRIHARLNEYIGKYYEMESAIVKELANLERNGSDCMCSLDEREVIKVVHEGEFDEILTYCVICGGDVFER